MVPFTSTEGAPPEGHFAVTGAAGPIALFSGLRAEELAHAYCLTGPAGVGKKTFARRLAQSLLCSTPKSTLLGYCGRCVSCLQVEARAHPDLLLSAGEIKIGDRDSGAGFHDSAAMTARDLVRQLSLHSYSGGRRIFILGDVEFTREAANALLKFFEEPPPGVLLLLTTSVPGRLLATIRSRLVEVTFPLLSESQIAQVLEGQGVAAQDAARAAIAAQGSVSVARAVLERGEDPLRDHVVEWFFAVARGETADNAWATRATLEDGLGTVRALARDRLALALDAGVRILTADQRARLEALPKREPAALLKALSTLGEAERTARTNVSAQLVAEMARMALT